MNTEAQVGTWVILCCFSGALAGSWMGSGIVRTQTDTNTSSSQLFSNKEKKFLNAKLNQIMIHRIGASPAKKN